MGCCCCEKRRSLGADDNQRCCIRDPFAGDGYLRTAQITSIIAVCMSWLWWPTFVCATLVFVNLQVIWCCRMEKRGLLITGILAFFGFGTSLFIGIYMLVVCWENLFIVVNTEGDIDHHYGPKHDNMCNSSRDHETAWPAIMFVESALCLIIWYCIFHFIFYRYDSIMAKISKKPLQEEQEQHPAAVVGIEVAPLPVTVTATAMLEAEGTIDEKV